MFSRVLIYVCGRGDLILNTYIVMFVTVVMCVVGLSVVASDRIKGVIKGWLSLM